MDMSLRLPEGKRFAVNIGVDFDTHDGWIGSMGMTTPGALSRGEFGAEAGLPRLLRVLKKYDITTTFCTPTHTMMTFPAAFESVMAAGHEIAAHGLWHERILDLGRDEEERVLVKQLEQHERLVGKRPRGYRSPSWDFSDHTLGLLESAGLAWDSSLMGHDFRPYHPRPVVIDLEEGNTFGAPSSILEIPVSWYLDDFPAFEFVGGSLPGLASTDVVLKRWTDYFDYGYEYEPGGVFTLTVHPDCIGHASTILMLDKFLSYLSDHDVWFATLSEIFDAWQND